MIRNSAHSRLAVWVALLVSGLIGAPGLVQAQDSVSVDSGLVVRMWMGNVETRGRLLQPIRSLGERVRYCRYPGPPCVQPIRPTQLGWFRADSLDHLDVQAGNRASGGAWIGGAIGFLLVGLGGKVAQGFCDVSPCPSDFEVLAASVLGGGVIGGLVGAIIGSGFPKFERRF